MKKIYGICIILGSYAYCPSYVPLPSSSYSKNRARIKLTSSIPQQPATTSNNIAKLAEEAAARSRQSRLSTVIKKPVIQKVPTISKGTIPSTTSQKIVSLTKEPDVIESVQEQAVTKKFIPPKPQPGVTSNQIASLAKEAALAAGKRKSLQKVIPSKVLAKSVDEELIYENPLYTEEPIYDNPLTVPTVQVVKKSATMIPTVKKPATMTVVDKKPVISGIPYGTKVRIANSIKQAFAPNQQNQDTTTYTVPKDVLDDDITSQVSPATKISTVQKIGITSQAQRQMLQRSLTPTKPNIIPPVTKPGDSTQTSKQPEVKGVIPVDKQVSTKPPLAGRLHIRGVTGPITGSNNQPIIQDGTLKGGITKIDNTTTSVQPPLSNQNSSVIRTIQSGTLARSTQQNATVNQANVVNKNTQMRDKENVKSISRAGLERDSGTKGVQAPASLSGKNLTSEKLVSITTLPKRMTNEKIKRYINMAQMRMDPEGVLQQEAKIPLVLSKDDTGGLN